MKRRIFEWWARGRGRIFLRPLSWAYGLGYWARRGWLCLLGRGPASVPGLRVVSVGNLGVGGSGKTPTALAVGAHYLSRGRRVAFLSRGYGRRGGIEPQAVKASSPVEQAGDEPLLLSRRLPRAGMVVDRDRGRGAAFARDRMRAEVAVLDDGFQQRLFLRRDLDLLLLDAQEPGQGGLLPAGSLREPLSQGRAADALIFSGARDAKSARRALEKLPAALKGKPVFWASYRPQSLIQWPSGRSWELKKIAGLPVAALSGIARPQGFEGLLESRGASLVWRRRFPDHHAFSRPELEAAACQALEAGARAMVTTEKDAMRLPKGWQPALPLLVLRVEWKVEPSAKFGKLLDGIWKK